MSDLRNEAKAIVRAMMVHYHIVCQRVYSEKRKTVGETNIDGRTLKFYMVDGKRKNLKKVIRKSNKRLRRLGLFVEVRRGDTKSIHVLLIRP